MEVQIGEYDTDVGAKEEELAKARGEYEEVLRQLGEYNRGYGEMLQERLEYEERERRLADQRFQVSDCSGHRIILPQQHRFSTLADYCK